MTSMQFLAHESIHQRSVCRDTDEKIKDRQPGAENAQILVALLDGAPEHWHYLVQLNPFTAEQTVRGKCKEFVLMARTGAQSLGGCAYPKTNTNEWFRQDQFVGQVFIDALIVPFSGPHAFFNAIGAALKIHDECRHHNTAHNLGWQDQIHARIAVAESFIDAVTMFRPEACVGGDWTAVSHNVVDRQAQGTQCILHHLPVRVVRPYVRPSAA